LPDQVRQPQNDGDHSAEPGIRGAELTARGGNEQYAHEYREKEDGNGRLVVEAESGQQTSKEPQPRAIVV
jgi:hypothetical protein